MAAQNLAPELEPARAAASPAVEPAELDPRPLAQRYRRLFALGKGGMGSVEAALEIDPGPSAEPLRVVALKRLLPEGRDARRVEMFLREAKLARMLDHPSVVRAYAYGELEGELFLAMEYVEGQPLSRVLRALHDRGLRMAPAVAAHVLAEVCEGLHAAHELRDPNGQLLNVVHRDVSPQNVMIGYDGRVRLLDFGVAKMDAGSVTKTGEVKGKTAYMSPEQAMGDRLDRRSDLFGVGAVLFECIAGRRMWGDGTDMDVIRKLALESPPRLEDAARDAPAALSELHARLVAREAEARPGTAREVAEALRGLAADRSSIEADLAATMSACFGEEASAMRSRLEEALEDAAPARARELRESIEPVAPRGPRAASSPPEPPAQARATRARLALGVGALAVLGLAALFAARGRSVAKPTALAPAATPAPVAPAVLAASATSPSSETAAARATGAPGEPPSPAPSASAAPPRAAAPPATAAASLPRAALARPPASAAMASPSSRPAVPRAPSPAPVAPVTPADVDPTPF